MAYFLENLPVTITTNKKNKTVISIVGDFEADNLIQDKQELKELATKMITVEADNSTNKESISVLVTQEQKHDNRLTSLEADNTENKAVISNLVAQDYDHEYRISKLEHIVSEKKQIIFVDSLSPYKIAQDDYVYIVDTSCTFGTIRIPENQDTHFGFSFRVIDYGSGGFQIVQSDNQQIIAPGTVSTLGSNGGLKSLSKFGAVSLILVKKGAVDVFVIDGELPSNMVLF